MDKLMLTEVYNCWNSLRPYRSERLRCKNYTYGEQWKDIVTAEGGRRITEEQYIREQGSSPLKNNLIRRIVRNVLGVFRNNYSIPGFEEAAKRQYGTEYTESDTMERLKTLYGANVGRNCLGEIYSRVMEEYLIGGLAVVRKRITTVGGDGVMTDMVRPDSFFFNTDATDPRGWDIRLIGEIHTLSDERIPQGMTGRRLVEVWRMEPTGWRYYFIDEGENILFEGDSPFPYGGHPYVVKAYPFIDGEIHSFVADCIDQQRYINRLITLNDWIIRASAKGVLLFPESAIPDDLELEEIAAQWSRYNGVIRYKAKAGVPNPQQVSTNTSNAGISELLGVQLKMMEDVSGINSALQGQLTSGAVSGKLYEQQTRHALTGLADIMEGFRVFMLDSALKDLQLLEMML